MVELEFRDGIRLVPQHVADLLIEYETETMTYDEAIKKANTGMARRFANDSMNRIIDQHRSQWGDR